jgi:hypothetical protein
VLVAAARQLNATLPYDYLDRNIQGDVIYDIQDPARLAIGGVLKPPVANSPVIGE